MENTTRLVYLNANSVTGGGTNYDTAAIFRRGGYLVAMATWTIDGGTGPDDHLVLVTSEGELAVFVGNDPASWSYKGTYYIAPPMGKRPFIKMGGDLLFLSRQGLYPLSKALLVATLDRSSAVSEKVNPDFVQFGLAFGTSEIWSMTFDFNIPALLISVPNGFIYGINTQTKAWFKFNSTAWSVTCLGSVGSTVFMGSDAGTDERVLYFTSGTDDVGTAIDGIIQWGYLTLEKAYTVKVDKFQPLWLMPASGGATISGSFQLGAAAGVATFTNTNTTSQPIENTWFGVPDVYSKLKTPYFAMSADGTTSGFVLNGINLAYKTGNPRLSAGAAWTV